MANGIHKIGCRCGACRASRGDNPAKDRAIREKISVSKLEWHKNNPNAVRGKNNPMYGSARFGDKNPRYGVSLSKKTRRKIAKSVLERHKEGCFVNCYSDSANEKRSRAMTGRSISMARREKLSLNKAKSFVEGRIKFKTGRFYSEKNKKKIFYRSSYELKAYQILEQLSSVVAYLIEPFYIRYRFGNLLKCYIPDILVTHKNGSKELIEVMSAWESGRRLRKAKLAAGMNYCKANGLDFSVWTERELGL